MYTDLKQIKEVAGALAEHHAAVMIGSGFSKNAEKIGVTENKFLDWNQLSDMFYEKVYGANTYPGKNYSSSMRLAQEAEIMIGRPGVEKVLKQAVPDDDYAPSELYLKLMQLPWKDVFTTNYDTLLERAADLVTNRRYNTVVCQEDLVNSGNAPRIIKLHGSFPSHRPFIITEEDYRTYPVKFAAMVNTVQQSLLENVFCMIGFSCEDPNFISWIGWIHDHLGKSSSQKIYMVSVLHIPEAKQRLYFERNIVLIDLEAIWPEKNISERLGAFFELLEDEVKKEEKHKQWFEWSVLDKLRPNMTFARKSNLLRKLRDTYPGWIFLPWDLKKRVSHVMSQLEVVNGIEKVSPQEQLDYMYEHVKFFDLGGRPLISQTVELFCKTLQDIKDEELDISKEEKYIMCAKKQTVYLHLLRAYREMAEWDEFENCRKKIDESALDYEEKQFLYAEESRRELFGFRAENLAKHLEGWKLSTGDVYWPLIKGQLLAMTGELGKAEDILMDNLMRVRKQLMKKSHSPYLISVEESTVSLINFIRQSSYGEELEKCIHEGALSWWDENEKYYLNLKSEQPGRKRQTTKYNFDLTRSITEHFGIDNRDIFIAMEYWRFFEQTGHSFRIANVTCKDGLDGSVKRLCKYYPYWSLMQVLNAQEKKCADYFWNRTELAHLSMEEVDENAKEYLEVFKTVIQQTKVENSIWSKSIYEQAAGVLPMILARFCYKCSVKVLDELLELLLQMCLSNKQTIFQELKDLIKAVIEGYTLDEQEKRVDKILQFPIASDRTSKYWDPVRYMEVPERPYKLKPSIYNKVMLQIRQEVEAKNPQQVEDGLNRFINLKNIICLEKIDEEYLTELLQNQATIRSQCILYMFPEDKNKNTLMNIVEETFDMMRTDGSIQGVSFHGGGRYDELIYVLGDVHFCEYNIIEWFQVMLKLVETTELWIERTSEAKERIRQCCMIAQGILISLYKDGKILLTQEEKRAIAEYVQKIEQIYCDVVSFKIINEGLIQFEEINKEELTHNLWMCDSANINLVKNYLYILSKYGIEIRKNENLYKCLCQVATILTYRLINANLEEANEFIQTLTMLEKYECFSENIISLLALKLELLLQETVLEKYDGEKLIYDKMHCRIEACKFASELYKKKYDMPIIMEWKKISESTDEFIEIRKIEFEREM
jgi:hypothetical protein